MTDAADIDYSINLVNGKLDHVVLGGEIFDISEDSGDPKVELEWTPEGLLILRLEDDDPEITCTMSN